MTEAAKTFDVFLSHHSGDKPWVIALKAALVARAVTVWLDRDEIRPGDLFVDVLERGVQQSRCVVIIVSPESMKSTWVREEYFRALTLANDDPSFRLIPCVRRAATLPGFLASRQWVDFRDPAAFEEKVDELCFGITGRRGPEGPRSAPARTASSEVTDAEIAFLDRSIGTAEKARKQLLVLRVCSPLLGLPVGMMWPQVPGPSGALPYLGTALFLGLLGVGATARRWAEHGNTIKRLTAHRNALELCLHKPSAVCPDIVNAFNQLIRRSIGIADAPAERVQV
jgi:TIR domain